jgi:predicted N-acyltransferase
MRMQVRIIHSLDEIPSSEWNRLNQDNNPFLTHEFLAALEHNQCVGETFGWLSQHIALYDDDRLVAATPLYLKDNSYGEFVFDWSWADAYHRAGLPYYPKLVSSVPYTPVTGNRLLTHPDYNQADLSQQLVKATLNLARELNVSSTHWLFPKQEERDYFIAQGLLKRIGTQFHWFNRDYNDFDDFLSSLSSSKRKKIKRERRRVIEENIEIKVIRGDQSSTVDRQHAEYFYRTTFDKKFGYATLNPGFFDEVCQTMGKQVLFFFAYHNKNAVACAICFQNDKALYGRHWGCTETFHSLHFELCYYQGIEYCIRHGKQLFEPGAQGEHKISRGFIPVETCSMHWIQDEQFRLGISRFLDQETEAIIDYMKQLSEHSPYKEHHEPAC